MKMILNNATLHSAVYCPVVSCYMWTACSWKLFCLEMVILASKRGIGLLLFVISDSFISMNTFDNKVQMRKKYTKLL